MKRKTRSAPRTTIEPPALTKRTLALFEKALEDRENLRRWIGELSSRPNLTVRDRLCLALYRQHLSFREPRLPPGAPLNAMTVRQYWVSAPEKYEEYESRTREIESYLKPAAELERETLQQKVKMLDLISSDATTFQLMYPVVEDVFKKPAGRHVSRPAIAVRALQLKIDTGRSWMEIAAEVCDCGKNVHDDHCRENLRQSVRALRDLLQKCGVEVPST
jgi:hypothetical protein